MLLTMEIFRTVFLLLTFCFYTLFCHPSRPLNERSTELAWQAWLLVDDQNQNKHHDLDSFTRRRITPKSVFIAPTFSPESLPACAEGYRADSMGRCIRIIKLDEEAHLDFLLEKLNAQFGNYDDDEDSQEEIPTPGPFQLNIPLNGGGSRPTKDADDSLDIAIVVAPTNGNFAIDANFKNSVKRTSALDGDSKIQENLPQNEQPVLPVLEDTTVEPTIVNRFLTDQDIEKTTTTESTTVLASETPTTTDATTICTSTIEPTETTTVELESDTTTNSNQHALFFLEHSLTKTKHVQNGTNNTEDTPELSTTTDNNLMTTTTTDLSEGRPETTTPGIEQSQSVVRFPTDEQSHFDYVKNPEKITEDNLLPNSYVSTFETTKTPSTEQFEALFNEYINSRGADLKGTERFIFKDAENKPKNDRYHSGPESYFNHRNRDKNSNMWTVPPSWSRTNPQKPIVFRFSRRSNGRHLLDEQIHNPREFYREVPSREFSYFFGIDSMDPKQSRTRNRR